MQWSARIADGAVASLVRHLETGLSAELILEFRHVVRAVCESCGDDQQVRLGAVEHRLANTVEPPAVALGRGLHPLRQYVPGARGGRAGEVAGEAAGRQFCGGWVSADSCYLSGLFVAPIFVWRADCKSTTNSTLKPSL